MTETEIHWQGTDAELTDLFEAIHGNSTCRADADLDDCCNGRVDYEEGPDDAECPSHSLLAVQATLDRLLYVRRSWRATDRTDRGQPGIPWWSIVNPSVCPSFVRVPL